MSVSGSTIDIHVYFEFKDKNAVNQSLQYMRKKSLMTGRFEIDDVYDNKQIPTWIQMMSWGSAAQMTEWTIK